MFLAPGRRERVMLLRYFELDEEANVKKSRIGRTVIKSDRRFTYEEAQLVIETGEGDYKDEILILDALAKKLRENVLRTEPLTSTALK